MSKHYIELGTEADMHDIISAINALQKDVAKAPEPTAIDEKVISKMQDQITELERNTLKADGVSGGAGMEVHVEGDRLSITRIPDEEDMQLVPFDRYLAIGNKADCATLDSENTATNYDDTLEPYRYIEDAGGAPTTDLCKTVVLRSDFLLGASRPFSALCFDIGHPDLTVYNDLYQDDYPDPAISGEVHAIMIIRAITNDFDPTAITYASAYSGGSPLTFASGTISLDLYHKTANDDGAHWITGGTLGMTTFPPAADPGIPAAWQSADIYGFEITFSPSGGGDYDTAERAMSSTWTEMTAYVLLAD